MKCIICDTEQRYIRIHLFDAKKRMIFFNHKILIFLKTFKYFFKKYFSIRNFLNIFLMNEPLLLNAIFFFSIKRKCHNNFWLRKKASWELFKDSICWFEQILIGNPIK